MISSLWAGSFIPRKFQVNTAWRVGCAALRAHAPAPQQARAVILVKPTVALARRFTNQTRFRECTRQPCSIGDKYARARARADTAAFEPFGDEPRRTGEQFDRSNPYVPGAGHGHVPLVITNGEPVLRIMHQRLRGLKFGKMARHMRVSQCLGAIGGKDWYLGVASPGNTVTLDHVAAFHIPGDRIVKLHVGTWHAGPHFTHDEAMFLNLENADTNSRDFEETTLPVECMIAPNAEACDRIVETASTLR